MIFRTTSRTTIGVLFCSLLAVLTGCGDSSSGSDGVPAGPAIINLTNGQAASVVLGQADFVSSAAGNGAAGINTPYGSVFVDSGKLYIPDSSHHRVKVHNSIPATNGASADYAIGQPDLTTYTLGLSATELSNPRSMAIYGNKLFIADYLNSRVAIYNTVPAMSPGTIDVVLGQVNKTSNATACTATGLQFPETVWVAGGKIVVASNAGHRVLIWNSIPVSDGQAADLVLGQPDFTTCSGNTGGRSASSMQNPTAAWTDGTRLVVADTLNHRVLIWNTFPTSNGQAADLVLGQADFTSGTANRGGAAAADTLNDPFNGVFVRAGQLFVADSSNSRVLVWNSFPTSNGQAADRVIGQPDFVSTTGVTTASGMDYPVGVHAYGNQLFVSEESNNRVTIFNGN